MSIRLLLLGSFLLLTGCSDSRQDPSVQSPPDVQIPFRTEGKLTLFRDGAAYTELAIEIAETDSTRNRGMMQRESMPDHSGMLFLFDTEEERSFWMANTPIALDLIFIDADSVVIRVAKYTQPMSPEPITSNGPVKFVLELAAGYSDTIGLTEGERISFSRRSADDGH